MPFKSNICCLQFRIKEVEASQHNILLKCIKIYRIFCKLANSSMQKSKESSIHKKAFMIELVLICLTRIVPLWPNCQDEGRSCCCPFPRPSSPRPSWCLPAPAQASVQCSLHQLPAGRPNFKHKRSLSILFMVFQSSRLFPASGHGGLMLLP